MLVKAECIFHKANLINIKDIHVITDFESLLDQYEELASLANNPATMPHVGKFDPLTDSFKDPFGFTRVNSNGIKKYNTITAKCEELLKLNKMPPNISNSKKTIVLILISILFIALTVFVWDKTNNQYEPNDINLAYNIIKTIESADMNNPGDMGKIKSAYKSYRAIYGKYTSLPTIYELQNDFDIYCGSRKETNNEYVCLLTSNGQAKTIQMLNALCAFVKTAEQKRSLFIPTASNSNCLEWVFFVLQILSYIASIITIHDFINRLLKRNQGNI